MKIYENRNFKIRKSVNAAKEERLPATSFGTKIFWEYQLYISYVLPRPQRFKNEIWESENRKIFHKLFSKIVIDPV